MDPPRPPDPPSSDGKIVSLITAAKGLTISNAVVIIMLAPVIIGGYFVWRALDDPAILDRFLSFYRVVPSPMASCILRQARQRGEPYIWSINTGFAFEGGKRWSVGVILDLEPTLEEQKSYCETLQLIVDWMHGQGELPNGLVWQYKDVRGREGEKGLDGER
jgi:hypothetical protein